MKNKLLKVLASVFVFMSLAFVGAFSVKAFDTDWTNNPNNCQPLSSTDLYNGQSCYPDNQVFCGLSGVNVQCADLSSVTTPPAGSNTSSTIYDSSTSPGYVVNCLATADAASPFCNNNGTYWCNADTTCLNTNHRVTQCNGGLWASEGGSYTCTNSCVSSYYDCDGGLNCERRNGSACVFLPGIDGTYVCTADAGGSCRNEISGGGSTYTCTCTPGKSFFETGTNTMYSTTDPLLWGTQYSTGDLINFGNSTTAEVFNVDNTGLLTTTNSTVNTMRIAFNDGVGTVGLYSINTNPDGTLAGNKGSLAMDYVNGKVYVNIDGSTDWNQLLDDSTPIGPTYTISTGLTDTSGTLTADISTGLAGGQTIYGGTGAGENLTIDSTTNASKGNILLNPNGGNVGIGTNNPSEALEVSGNLKISKEITTEDWNATSIVDAPEYTTDHTAVWTGKEMIIWGGVYRTNPSGPDVISDLGWNYNPNTDIWRPISSTLAPSARYSHTAIWTGSKMIVWGGFDGSGPLDTGAMYDPETDTWQTMSTSGAPAARYLHTAVWTGNKMVVWGGESAADTYFNDGAIFDPSTNTWTPFITNSTLSARDKHTMVWSGKEILIWGGVSSLGAENTGESYNLETGAWSTISTVGAPIGRHDHEAIWTGNKMLILGGMPNDPTGGATGGLYDPITNTWKSINADGYLDVNYYLTLIWTGDKAIAWGGKAAITLWGGGKNSGAIYDPSKDSWTIMKISGDTPAARIKHTAIWTGSKMIVWGGKNSNMAGTFYLNTGGIYTPPDSQGNLLVEGNAFINGQLSTVGDITAGGYYSISGADLAENYIAADSSITAGDVVKLTSGLKLSKTMEVYDPQAVGVVSSKPGMTLSDISQIADEDKNNLRPLALSGRVPVKVTTENGNIEVGDYLVPASKPGYAMKQCGINSCNSGIVIGRAIEEFKSSDTGDTKIVIEKLESNIAEVESTIDAIESSDKINNEIKSEVSNIVDVATTLSRTMNTGSYGEGRILMFVDLGYRLTPQQESYLKSISVNTEILSNSLTMNQIDSNSLSVVDMNVTGLLTTDKISTNQIMAFKDQNFSLNLGDSEGNTEFRINNALGEKVFSVSSLGKLFVSDAKDKGSVGSGIIKAGELTVKIDSRSMNINSKVFLTLTTKVENPPSLVVSKKLDGSFEVSINEIKEENIGFDWWIIN